MTKTFLPRQLEPNSYIIFIKNTDIKFDNNIHQVKDYTITIDFQYIYN